MNLTLKFWSSFRKWRIQESPQSDKLVMLFVNEFIGNLVRLGIKEGISIQELLLWQPLHLMLTSTTSQLHAMWSNKVPLDYIGMLEYTVRPETLSYEERLKELQQRTPSDDWRGVSLDASLIDMNEKCRNELLESIASVALNNELYVMERRNSEMYLYPIFSSRDFTSNDKLCFILMPFSDDMLPIYQDHIRKALEKKLDLTCLRADDIFDNTSIIESVWKSINEARVIIADLTGRNPNVFYEVGLAHTIGKDVVLLAQSIEDVPFDLRHWRVILYNYTPRGCKELERKLVTTVSNILKAK